jgi:hypothetical protein
LLNADKSDRGHIARDQCSGGKQYKIEQTHGGPPALNGSTGPIDSDDSDAGKDDPTDEPTNKNHCQFSAQVAFEKRILRRSLKLNQMLMPPRQRSKWMRRLPICGSRPGAIQRWEILESRAQQNLRVPCDDDFARQANQQTVDAIATR